MRNYFLISVLCVFVMIGCQSNASFQDANSNRIKSDETKSGRNFLVRTEPESQPELGTVVEKSLFWLIEAQAENGAWGAGSHAKQKIKDPKAVQVDPATTAFAAMALLRSGNTLKSGPYKENLSKALNYLLSAVEESPENSNNITTLTGTQPQVKLGQNIDASMASRFFTRILPYAAHDAKLQDRIIAAQNKCLSKIQGAQSADGSIAGGTWAGVLQSAVANIALEEAAETGAFEVDDEKLKKIQEYQTENVNISSGAVATDRAAGVQLYSLSSTSRSTAKQARRAKDMIEKAQAEGVFGDARVEDIEINEDNLKKAGLKEEEAKNVYKGAKANEIARTQVQQERVMVGFGNNGGEEFLSHMMTSESLVVTGGDEWESWNKRIKEMMAQIQNPDGSYSGHHCITSPVFCTSAVILALTVEHDETLLVD